MTVQHILIDCPDLYYKRLDFYFAPNMKYLFENIPPSTIVDFVKEIDIYKEIWNYIIFYIIINIKNTQKNYKI